MIFCKALFLQLFFISINFRFSVAIKFVDKTSPRNCFQEFLYELSFRKTYLKYASIFCCAEHSSHFMFLKLQVKLCAFACIFDCSSS